MNPKVGINAGHLPPFSSPLPASGQPSPPSMAQTPTPVDCKDCEAQFPTFKGFLKHLLAKECGLRQQTVIKPFFGGKYDCIYLFCEALWTKVDN